ncbi:hypothetical protein KCU73_g11878, partial [Aureobasidium melanogenum]
MAEVRSYHVMGVMTSDMTSQMAVNVPVAGPRVSDEIRHQQSPRESGLRRGILYSRFVKDGRYSVQSDNCHSYYSDYLEDAVAADIVHGRAV